MIEGYLGKIAGTSKKSGVPITYQFDFGSIQGPFFLAEVPLLMFDRSTVYIVYRKVPYRRHFDERSLGEFLQTRRKDEGSQNAGVNHGKSIKCYKEWTIW